MSLTAWLAQLLHWRCLKLVPYLKFGSCSQVHFHCRVAKYTNGLWVLYGLLSVSATNAHLFCVWQNQSVSHPSQQYSENWLYIGIGLCVVLLAILFLALFLTRRKYFSQVGRVHEITAVADAIYLLLQGSELTSLGGRTLCPALWLCAQIPPVASGAQNSKVPMWCHCLMSWTP